MRDKRRADLGVALTLLDARERRRSPRLMSVTQEISKKAGQNS